MEEIKQLADKIELRSIERSQSKYREFSLGKNEM